MQINITEIERCARAATQGVWHWDADPVKGDPLGRQRSRVTTIGKTITQAYYPGDEGEKDAAHIAGNHPAVTLAFCEVVKAAKPLFAQLDSIGMPREEDSLMEALRRALAAFQEKKP